jgi:hypothetical protein
VAALLGGELEEPPTEVTSIGGALAHTTVRL